MAEKLAREELTQVRPNFFYVHIFRFKKLLKKNVVSHDGTSSDRIPNGRNIFGRKKYDQKIVFFIYGRRHWLVKPIDRIAIGQMSISRISIFRILKGQCGRGSEWIFAHSRALAPVHPTPAHLPARSDCQTAPIARPPDRSTRHPLESFWIRSFYSACFFFIFLTILCIFRPN